MCTERRAFITVGGLAAIASVAAVGGAPVPAQAEPRQGQDTVRFASQFGAVGDGRRDDTAALQSAIDWSSDELGTVMLDSGTYAVDALRVGPQARVIGAGAGHTFYPGGEKPLMAGSVIVPRSQDPSPTPLVTISEGASGAQLQNLSIDGLNWSWGAAPADPASRAARVGLAVSGGVEVTCRDVRVTRFAATGIAIELLNNARWTDVFVDRCGTANEPAMLVRSTPGGTSNFLVFEGLTIERSANAALHVAVGDDPVRDWASNVTFIGLHVESNQDFGANSFPINSEPLVDVGNIRAVSFIAPQLLGGAAPVLRYRQRVSTASVSPAPGGDARDQQGGLFVVGGQIEVHSAGTTKVAAIDVGGAGRAVSLLAVKFAALPSVPAVHIASDYAFDVSMLGCTHRWVGPPVPAVADERSSEVRRHWGATAVDGDFEVRGGDLRVGGRQVRVAARSPQGTTRVEAVDTSSTSAGWVDLGARGPGTDTAGRLFMANWKPLTGALLRVVFERPFPAQPVVVLTARNERAAVASLFVELEEGAPGTTGFRVSSAVELDRSAEALLVDYLVIGRE